MPRDFREVFVRVGWTHIEAEMKAHKKTVRRWLDECGYDEIRAERAAYVKANGIGRRASSYVMGRRSAVSRDQVEG